MFAEKLSDENVGCIKEDSSATKLGLLDSELPVSMFFKSSFERTAESSMKNVKPHSSDDHLCADGARHTVDTNITDSIDNFTEFSQQKNDGAKHTVETTAIDSIGIVDLPEQSHEIGPCNSKFDSSGPACIVVASPKIDCQADDLSERVETDELTHPLIVYTSSRRSSRYSKLDLNSDGEKSPRYLEGSAVNMTSLQISRQKRSSLPTRARCSGWGYMGNILPDSEKKSLMKTISIREKKPRREKAGQRIRNALNNKTSQKSRGKTYIPTGHISLKIKIGNRGLDDFTKTFHASDKMLDEPCARNPEIMGSYDASFVGTRFDNIVEIPCASTPNDCQQMIAEKEVHNSDPLFTNCSDPGTSPDSEVINSVPDDPPLGIPGMQDKSMMPKGSGFIENVSCLKLTKVKSVKEGIKFNIHQDRNCTTTINTLSKEISNDVDVPATCLPRKRTDNIPLHEEEPFVTVTKPHFEIHPSSKHVDTIEQTHPVSYDISVPCTKGKKLPNCSKINGKNRRRSKKMNLPCESDKPSKKKGNQIKFGGKQKLCEKGDATCPRNDLNNNLASVVSADHEETGSLSKGSRRPISGFQISVGGVKEHYASKRNAWVLCDLCEKWRRIPAALADQIEETKCGWTCKDNTDTEFDDCSVPQEKSNADINDELEISDASCEEDTSLMSNEIQSKVPTQTSWSLIKSNLFLHRSRKTQTIDDVMVCHCKPPSDGRMGCGTKCLNRMLNIECVRGTCPCGELCSNQQFQRRKYAKLKWFKCGKKGHGLQALDDISEGKFLIEYVGEVLDVRAYEGRQREYALNGHKHFYFMTLNGSEVIDACAKGNLGRFINHSCDPNCRTEKWMVNGEVCVGLFAVKDIKKGEEVTFDYNYVRVFGAAAKKCVCGSHNCRGYIGGDPSSSEVIVQGDSDDECSEPLMVCEDREMNDDWNDIMSNSMNERVDPIIVESLENRSKTTKLERDVGLLESTSVSEAPEILTQQVEVISASPEVLVKTSGPTSAQHNVTVRSPARSDCNADAVSLSEINKKVGEFMNRHLPVTSEVEGISPPQGCTNKDIPSDNNEHILTQKCAQGAKMNSSTRWKSESDVGTSKSKLKHVHSGQEKELSKFNALIKTHRSPISIKKGKMNTDVGVKGAPEVRKLKIVPHKSESLPELFSNGHFEAVEEKLNELLDPEGGISKRKDASRGYLKLLFLTAASGNTHHPEAIQSNRDLSMILDALLKTKSRAVLVDIIDKNGLQMLHNIMKRCTRDYMKTPILRKLLKILEYLATREILKLEHMTGGPPRPGVESFKDSILSLTEFPDKQVHQSARNFRDRWIPRSFRKNFCTEREDAKIELPQRPSNGSLSFLQDHCGKPSEATKCTEAQSATPCTFESSKRDPSSNLGSREVNGTNLRKRKSRWDNPTDDQINPNTKINLGSDRKLNIDEDIPPGFSSPCNQPMIPSDSSIAIPFHDKYICMKQPPDIVVGDSQHRFNACMPLSYGIPSRVIQQFSVRAESSEGWTIAPGVPFHPFPPLPLYSRNEGEPPSSSSMPNEKVAEVAPKFSTHSGHKHARTPDMDPPESNSVNTNGRTGFLRGNSYNMGRNYFRQQKWTHSKLNLLPPWIRMRNEW